jgi:hypothetical protein
MYAVGLMAAIGVILSVVDVRSARRARRLAAMLEENRELLVVSRESEEYVRGYVDGIERRPPRRRLRVVE